MSLSLDQLNREPLARLQAALDGLYEHSPWVVARALAKRPFASLSGFKVALAQTLALATLDEQHALICAHPELAGKAMVAKTLTAESTNEQSKAGLTQCTPEEFAKLQQLNAAYNAKFGFAFILAVRGARGVGLNKAQIISTFERRLHNPVDYERQECLRQINRIAEIRLDDKFGVQPALGNAVWDWHEALAVHSDEGFKERGELTVTYLTDAHLACAAQLMQEMSSIGFDEVTLDAVGNVVGIYLGDTAVLPYAVGGMSSQMTGGLPPQVKTLLTGSHYDTVRNGGKYDGRLGIYVPMMCVKQLVAQKRRLPFNFEVVGFAEEEGQRYKATFLGSGALTGDFNPAWLDQQDADGISMRQAMLDGGLPAQMPAIQALKRDPANYLGFVEVHIEQGPVLNELNLPLGVVTSINGSVRYLCKVSGMAAHAGTTPMDRRADAAAAVAQMILAIESAPAKYPHAVATVGQLNVPSGSINVIPGECSFSIDLRSPVDADRNALEADILQVLQGIAKARGVTLAMDKALSVNAAPSNANLQARWEGAVEALGLPVHRMTSGAGHDAMKLHDIMPQAMLFVRGENAGISHNPLESSTAHDIALCVQAFSHFLDNLG